MSPLFPLTTRWLKIQHTFVVIVTLKYVKTKHKEQLSNIGLNCIEKQILCEVLHELHNRIRFNEYSTLHPMNYINIPRYYQPIKALKCNLTI